MMAAAGRESHRSAEKKLLSPPAAVNPLIGGARSYSKDESIVGDGAVGLGTAGLEAEVGNVDELFKAKPEQQQKLKKGSEPFKGGGGALKSPSRGRPSTKSSPPTENSTAAAATGEAGGGGDANKAPTRERTQQMYEIYRQTQEKLRTMRDESATMGCTFSPQLASKQKGRKSEEGATPDHLYQDFQKLMEKRERLAEEEAKKITFRPVLPTATSRLAAKATVTTAGHKSAEDKTKATAEAMYKECTFAPNTVITKANTEKILAAKGKQAPVADRLYASAEAQAALLKSREEARAAKELEACTFRPQISSGTPRRTSSGSGRGDASDTHERLFGLHGEMLMNKKTKREELAAKELMACTFSPALVAKPKTTKSEMSSTFGCLPFAFGDDDAGIGGRGKEPVHERLYSMRGRNQVREAFVDLECTFQPNLDRTSKSLASTHYRRKTEDTGGAGRESRLDTMYNEGKLRQTARSQSPRNYTATFREKDEDKEMELCTFQPNVSQTQTGRFKTESRGRALFETLYARREDHVGLRERIRQEDMKACTFSPELSSQKTRFGRSLSPQRQRPVYEELYDEAATQRFARTLSAGRLQSQQCPFKPQFATSSRTVRGGGTSNPATAAIPANKEPAGKQQASSGRSAGNRRAGAATATATATTAAGQVGGGVGGERLSMPWDDTMPASTPAAAAAPAMAAVAAPGEKRGSPASPAGQQVSPQEKTAVEESGAATASSEKEASSSTGGGGPARRSDEGQGSEDGDDGEGEDGEKEGVGEQYDY